MWWSSFPTFQPQFSVSVRQVEVISQLHPGLDLDHVVLHVIRDPTQPLWQASVLVLGELDDFARAWAIVRCDRVECVSLRVHEH